jgi:hypothetical protein
VEGIGWDKHGDELEWIQWRKKWRWFVAIVVHSAKNTAWQQCLITTKQSLIKDPKQVHNSLEKIDNCLQISVTDFIIGEHGLHIFPQVHPKNNNDNCSNSQRCLSTVNIWADPRMFGNYESEIGSLFLCPPESPWWQFPALRLQSQQLRSLPIHPWEKPISCLIGKFCRQIPSWSRYQLWCHWPLLENLIIFYFTFYVPYPNQCFYDDSNYRQNCSRIIGYCCNCCIRNYVSPSNT